LLAYCKRTLHHSAAAPSRSEHSQCPDFTITLAGHITFGRTPRFE